MKNTIKILFIILSIVVINSCSWLDGSDEGPSDIQIKMVNKSNEDTHMFLSSQGEDFGPDNRLVPNASRKVQVSGLVWKEGSDGEGYIPVEVVIKAGRNGVVLASKTVMVSKVGIHSATFNGSSISYSE